MEIGIGYDDSVIVEDFPELFECINDEENLDFPDESFARSVVF